MSNLKDYLNHLRQNQPAVSAHQSSMPVSEPSTSVSPNNLRTEQQTQAWDKWEEIRQQQESRKSIEDLHRDAYNAYRQNQNELAVSLFAQAAELAKQQKNVAAQAKNLHWEGESLFLDNHLEKALIRFLQAEELNVLDAIDSFRNLLRIVLVASEIPLPISEQTNLLKKLEPYKGSQQIGSSKSMVLYTEAEILASRGMNVEALAKSQEAFASRNDSAPRYADFVHYEDLFDSYRLLGQYPEAREILRQWKADAKYAFASEKSKILKAEAKLLYFEGRQQAAWDMMQKVYAEERYIHRAGKNSGTLYWMIRLGSELGHFEQIRPMVLQMLQFRRSESLFSKYSCYHSLARYCCQVCIQGGLSAKDSTRMHRHARFWLQRAKTVAYQLDQLLECDWRTKQIQSLRDRYYNAAKV